jgi:hypothetical protein
MHGRFTVSDLAHQPSKAAIALKGKKLGAG